MESVHESELHIGHGIHRVPLSVLRHDSSAKLSALKAELVDLINNDYASFIGISTALRSYTPLPQGHENTLSDTRNALTLARSAIQSEADHVKALLLRREKLRDAKAVLKSCIAIHDSVRKLESLLNIDSIASTDSSDSVDHGKLVERVAIEFNQLLFLVSSIQKQRKEPLAFVKNLQSRIDRIKSALTSILKESLDLSLASVSASTTSDMTSAPALTQCLRTYLLIDRVRDAGAGVRALVEPELMKLAQSSQTSTTSGNMISGQDASSGAGLLKFYKDVIAYIDVRFAKILAVSRQVFGGVSAASGIVGRKASGILSAQADAEVTALAHASQKSNSASSSDGLDYDFLVDEVMVIVWNCVIKYFSGSWNPGLPDLFHRNYLATTTFIEFIEKLYFLEGSSGVAHFRMHASTVDFLKKWNLEVYYRIRVKEVVSPYETTFSNIILDLIVLGEGSDGFHMPQTVALQSALKKAWSADLFIPALVPGFWKLSLQCLNRYSVWLKAVNDSIGSVIKDFAEGDTGVAVSGISTLPQGTAAASGGAALSSSSDGMASTVSVVAREDLLLQTVAAVLGDIGSLFREMEILFDKTIAVRLPSDFPNTKNLKGVFLKVPQDIESGFVPEFQSKCATILIKRCQIALEQVSVVVQTTRFSSKVPSVPSTYVSMILLPVITFFTLVASKNYLQLTVPGQASILRGWKLQIMEAVCVKYHAVVSKQLEDAAQLDKFSQRRRVGKAAAAAAAASGSANAGDVFAAANTPFEKIKEQMKLDVSQFKKEVDEILFSDESVDGAMEKVAEWKALCSVVGIESIA
ncbi:oligomeric golgi complex component, COG2-domain-containing protein [Chytriomyces cf. hyalinus JEL632]|nr:oligomeric golgi complex component, COG2-domain-containing protein [Chytriomyces cf. hyalinus JEL632]